MTKEPKAPKLTLAKAREEHARLQAEIAEHDRRYHGRGRADHFRRRIRCAAPALHRARRGVSQACRRGFRQSQGRRGAVGEIRQGPPPRADAVARQYLRRRGGRGVLRPGAALSGLERRRAARCRCGSQDRRALLQPALREWRTRPGGDARRRLRRRGRDRERARGGSDPEAPQGRAEDLRGARRGLHAPHRLCRAERAPGRRRQAGLRQSAQLRRRLAAPARSAHDRRAAACSFSPTPGEKSASPSPRPSSAPSRPWVASACRPIP